MRKLISSKTGKWFTSRTIWVGAVTLVYGILLFAGVVSEPFSPEILSTILGIIIIILRVLTKEPIDWDVKKK